MTTRTLKQVIEPEPLVTQADKDRANELSQNLGTLAADYRAISGANPSLEAMEAFDAACLKRTEQLFAAHRVAAIPDLVRVLGELRALEDKWRNRAAPDSESQFSLGLNTCADDIRAIIGTGEGS